MRIIRAECKDQGLTQYRNTIKADEHIAVQPYPAIDWVAMQIEIYKNPIYTEQYQVGTAQRTTYRRPLTFTYYVWDENWQINKHYEWIFMMCY